MENDQTLRPASYTSNTSIEPILLNRSFLCPGSGLLVLKMLMKPGNLIASLSTIINLRSVAPGQPSLNSRRNQTRLSAVSDK
jgi:hypothetical protein